MSDAGEQVPHAPSANTPALPDPHRRRGGAPPVVDAEFKVLPPAARLWLMLRRGWWAIGPYLVYCTALWGLAALVGWLMDRGRPG